MKTVDELQIIANKLWAQYQGVFPELTGFACPKIVYNNRFRSTAGVCCASQNIVELSSKFMVNNEAAMLAEILPHELAHQIDYNIFGDPHPFWHRKSWKYVMIKIGQKPDRCHNLSL